MKKFAAATILSASLAAPAFAGGLDDAVVAPVIVPPAAPLAFTPTWTGGYAGAQLGFIDGGVDVFGGDEADDDALVSFDNDGVVFGLRSGYDYQFANGAVLGGLLQYDRVNLDLEGDDDFVDELTEGDDDSVDAILRAGLRGGYGFGPNLAYATGGYARIDTDNSGDSNGYFAGIGYERLVTDSISVGGEVLYHEFDDFDDSSIEADATTASINVNYRF